VIKEAGARIGDWLARIGWGKFFLLAILALIFGGILSSALFKRSPAVIVERGPDPEVSVSVNVSADGVRIVPKRPAAPPAPPAPPQASAPATPGEAGTKGVVVDDRGVRINAEQDGRKVTVLIDAKGVRIAERASTETAPAGTAEQGVLIDPEATTDPERMAEAVEAARSKIEEIVSDQIRDQVARRTRVYQEKSSDWFMSLIFLLIVAGIIIKIVLGSKRKAEVRAQAATATAAEEGLKRQLAEAQLKMMQAQVEPHFLFNTLASVDYLIETDPARASTMQKNLIQYLRAAMPHMRDTTSNMGREAVLVESYLKILQFRMEERLSYTVDIPAGLRTAEVPPMMLLSLVENCIKHGLEPKPEGGHIDVKGEIADGKLRVTVSDTGLGFKEGMVPTSGTGVGLSNIRERLAMLYGGGASFTIGTGEINGQPGGTRAVIEIPYRLADVRSNVSAV
jgi:signal transduction histidine kinase